MLVRNYEKEMFDRKVKRFLQILSITTQYLHARGQQMCWKDETKRVPKRITTNVLVNNKAQKGQMYLYESPRV